MSVLRRDGRFELRFTGDEVDLILQDPLADGAVASQLRNAASAPDGGFVAMATQADLEDLLGSIAAAANHCENLEVVSRLERLYARLENLERALFPIENTEGEAPAARSKGARSEKAYVFQFRIELLGVDPPIWRRIQVSSESSLWDLHVAIQDAMGWQDCHLHEFTFLQTTDRIGIPLDDDAVETLPGWEQRVDQHLSYHAPLALYHYDFGDSWLHEVRFEEAAPMAARRKYPRCLAGARRCPPEDCGGSMGYTEFLEAISDPKHPEHESFVEWIGGPFDPEAFDARKVRFSDPKERLRRLLE